MTVRDLSMTDATDADVPEIARLRTMAAHDLAARFGYGHWAYEISETAVDRSRRKASVIVARDAGVIVGTLRLSSRKPWAIDRACYTPVPRPIYLTDMAVLPDRQRQGVGRALVAAAKNRVGDTPDVSLCLDAYDGLAGAGPFYERCGFSEVGRATYRGVPLIYFEWRPGADAAEAR
jgi:GNAT superfamily N-acetyltransferase